MTSPKRFLWLLAIAVLVLAILFWQQFRRALNITVRPSSAPLISQQTVDLPITADDWLLGNPGAPNTVVEFIDLGDTMSLKTHLTISNFVAAHPLLLRLVWKNLPGSRLFGGSAIPLHRAALCAAAQNKFWPYVNELATGRPNASEAALSSLAANLKLLIPTWTNCFTDKSVPAGLTADAALAEQLGITNAPAVFINNKQLYLAPDLDLKKLLETVIAP